MIKHFGKQVSCSSIFNCWVKLTKINKSHLSKFSKILKQSRNLHYFYGFLFTQPSNYTWSTNSRARNTMNRIHIKRNKNIFTSKFNKLLHNIIKIIPSLGLVLRIFFQFIPSNMFVKPNHFLTFFHYKIVMILGSLSSLIGKINKF
jgi:hypothetical protein